MYRQTSAKSKKHTCSPKCNPDIYHKKVLAWIMYNWTSKKVNRSETFSASPAWIPGTQGTFNSLLSPSGLKTKHCSGTPD